MGKNIRNNILLSIRIIIIIFIIIILFLSISKTTYNRPHFKLNEKNDIIGKISIPKIHLEEYLYRIDSKDNNIEKHITILKESSFPSILFLAAHSGEGKIAYFNNLDKLVLNDKVIIIYNKKKYIYIVKDIWEEEKNGYINLYKTVENQLVLTTCSPNKDNYQLIINCTEKDS